MSRILFYFTYGARSLWRSRRWSAFAVFSVAAGVATMVALRSLGLGIADSLTSNVRSSNHGDITLARGSAFFGGFEEPEDADVFSARQLQAVRAWAQQHNAAMAEYTSTNVQITALDFNSIGRLQFITALFIDPATYPPTDDIRALEPKGIPLRDLFQGGYEVIVSENLAQAQGIEVGERVRVSGTTQEFVVRGIVPVQAEAGLRDLFSAFFGFVYFDRRLAEALSINPNPNRISIALPEGTSHDVILRRADELNELVGGGWNVRIISVPRIIEQNQVVADVVGRFVIVMGLGAMLLGGVGIINTMLVMVRRRTEEIAALKTFGLKGRQVAALFMAEALILGAVGSLIGSAVGSFLSMFTNAYGETFIQQEITWRLYPEAIMFGTVLGMVVTAIFGVLPVLTAVKVPPNIILRPNETHIASAGILQSLLALVFVVVALGLVAGRIIGPFPENYNGPGPTEVGLIGVAATLGILGLLVCLMWILVWLVGKFPAFGLVELRLALRNMTTRRIRTATTLLALSAGMFALSSITFFGAGVREILQFTLAETFGGNVLVLPVLPAEVAQPVIDARLEELDGIEYRTRIMMYDGQLVQVDDLSLRGRSFSQQRQALQEQIEQALQAGDADRLDVLYRQLDALYPQFVEISVRDSNNPNLAGGTLLAGRRLLPQDRGQPVAVVKLTERLQPLDIRVGTMIVVEIGRRAFEFEVVGLIEDDQTFQSGALGMIQVPPEALGSVRPDFQLNTVQAEPERLNDVMLGIASIPLVFVVDIQAIDGVLSRLIEQFSALPLLVGLLSTGAAAVIMANTVALSTLERRRQIGILKAIGLKGRRVLRIMLLENVLVSLLGGLIGIGLSAVGVAVMSYFGLEDLIFIPRETLPIAAALVAAAVLIGGLATFLSANVAVRERVLNVLRYE